MSEDLSRKLEGYLRGVLEAPELTVSALTRIPGGASRETYRFRATYGGNERGLILRRDPPASLINTERSIEYRAYKAFHALGLPVPEPIALELSHDALERPFFIMEEIENCAVGSIMAVDPYGSHTQKIGEQFFTILGRIAQADPQRIGLGDIDGSTIKSDCWKHELARWEAEIDEDEREPQPIVRAAIRWLKKHPPPPAQKISVVHGDYRTGNFLFDGNGDIRAILDWEMTHLGDPLEDLGWALDPLWTRNEGASGTIPRAEAIAIWENASGLKCDPEAFRWWEIFASLKGAAIWISAAREYSEARNPDPINAFSGWYCLAFHNNVLANRIAELLP